MKLESPDLDLLTYTPEAPMHVRKEIPEISRERLEALARTIRPVVSLVTTPLGHYPHELVETYYLKRPKDLRNDTFVDRIPWFLHRKARLVEEGRIRTLHETGSAGRVFSPSIAEVLAQIPDEYLRPDLPVGRRLVAFETFQPKGQPEYEGYLHIATTVLLSKGSPVSGAVEFRGFLGR